MPSPDAPRRTFGGALAVGVGILASRVTGLVRESVLAHTLGRGTAADAFRASLRIPNLLQNLFGEGVLSSSFIPVYARLQAEGRTEDARRVARAIGTLLALVAGLLALLGVALARPLVELLAPGYQGEAHELTVRLVAIMFPGVALLVLSAWCLGVLNSHRRFLLPYVSPVLWNAALITAALAAARQLDRDADIAIWIAWGAVIGSAAQLIVQLPTVAGLLRSLRPSLAVRDPGVRSTLRAFGPVLLGRGSVQLSSFIDQALASYLGKGILTALSNAQTLYLLPVSLFGMATSAAELPEMSSAVGDDQARAAAIRDRLRGSLRRVAYLVVPSAVAFIMIGRSIIGLLFETGRFTSEDTSAVWLVLAGSAIGLSAGTQGRLLSAALYALGDTRAPLRAALVRVAVTGFVGWAFALPLRTMFGYSGTWGAFALTASAGVAAWVEFLLLKRWLARRIGEVPVPVRLGLGVLTAALAAGCVGLATQAVGYALSTPRSIADILTIAAFGIAYLAFTAVAKIPEAMAFVRRARRR